MGNPFAKPIEFPVFPKPIVLLIARLAAPDLNAVKYIMCHGARADTELIGWICDVFQPTRAEVCIAISQFSDYNTRHTVDYLHRRYRLTVDDFLKPGDMGRPLAYDISYYKCYMATAYLHSIGLSFLTIRGTTYFMRDGSKDIVYQYYSGNG